MIKAGSLLFLGLLSCFSVAPPAASERIWIAAKSGALAGKMVHGTDYAAGSLSGDLVYPNLTTNNTSNATQADRATYTVELPSAGTWTLWGRMYYPGTTAQPDNAPNSFWAGVDQGSALVLGNRTDQDRVWHWEGAPLGSLAAGGHTLRIWHREASETAAAKLSPRLDYLVLTNDAAYVPKDADLPAAPAAPYPPSPVIGSVTWGPIVRKGQGSDLWPLTWADDDEQYTAYGDGHGFDTSTPNLSLGLAKVSGSAPGTGTNLRSASIEQTGSGTAGKKASGILMVGGVLYLWVRNIDLAGNQSQLAWSGDHGTTWTWVPWKFAEFGFPTFINYGKNYAGARDAFVYLVSHDNPSAYAPADRFVLMRVPKDRIRDRAAYEFFRSRDAGGNPVWTTDVAQRGAVFTFPGRCRRSGITYNPGLRRYLWWQMVHENGVDNRFAGGFGVYDAPEPWGPWTTAYFATRWDVGPGETGSFPVKWMSGDGKTVQLVFSGDDSFSVRSATFSVAGPSVRIDSVSTAKAYSLGTAQVNALPYIDRSYVITSISSGLNQHPLIRTANDDKMVTANPHLKFTVSQPSTIFVCFDAARPAPPWLSDGTWTVDTSQSIAVNLSGTSNFRIHRKAVGAGQVSLGGNGSPDNSTFNYFVIVK